MKVSWQKITFGVTTSIVFETASLIQRLKRHQRAERAQCYENSKR